jgi:hypothetical protein
MGFAGDGLVAVGIGGVGLLKEWNLKRHSMTASS